eukprot:scaffold178252_cov37-Prasinocladus_malaysianus.AAC.1
MDTTRTRTSEGGQDDYSAPNVLRDTMEWPDDFQFGVTKFSIGWGISHFQHQNRSIVIFHIIRFVIA